MSRAPRVSQPSEVGDYIASWHATMQLLREGKSFSGRERNCAFLNTGGDRFANVSALTGLDFPDDARAIAAVDWDHDGDVDFWMHNRTGPRLRFMRNNTANHEHRNGTQPYVALRLVGVQSNRDAIGARVQVHLAETDRADGSRPLVQTVAAGDGYLSQSSKWLLFGLGSNNPIDAIEVRWPNGNIERFAAVDARKRYRLVEGTGVADPVEATRSDLAISAQPQLEADRDESVRVQFANPVPLPELPITDSATDGTRANITAKREMLIVLWASWCPNCIDELGQLQSMKPKLDAAAIDVLALNIDALSTEQDFDEHQPAAVLQRLNFTHATGFATLDLMNKLSVVQRIVLNRPLESAVPTMLLVNRSNELIGLYQGVHAVEKLIDDVQFSQNVRQRRDRSVPFSGRWTTPPDILLLRPVANIFAKAGYEADYRRYLELDRQRLTQLLDNADNDGERQSLQARFANDSFDLAMLLLDSGRADEAIEYFEAGLERFPKSSKGRLEYGRALSAVDRTEAAMEQFQSAMQLDPDNPRARFQVGLLAARDGQLELARESFRTVTQQQPNHADAWTNLGTVLARMKRAQEAIDALRTATQLAPTNGQAWLALGGQLATGQQYREAAACFQAATQVSASYPQAFAALGQCLVQLNEDEAALTALRRAIELNSRDAASRLQIAWVQATSPIEHLRDGEAAVKTAVELARLTGNKDPQVLDVLAAASAEVGNYPQAVKAAKAALGRLPANHPLRPGIQSRLNGYQASSKYRR